MYECPYSCSAVTAEALKIITAPSRHSASVTMNSHLSFSRRLGILSPRVHRIRPSRTRFRPQSLFQPAHQLLEHPAAMLVVLKLIEAGTGRREQHDVSRMGGAEGCLDSGFERSRWCDGHAAPDLLLDLVGGGTDQQRQNGLLAENIPQFGVIAAFVF